jgi:hypothetical protein
VHQVGFSLHDYIEMHGQQNIKKERLVSQHVEDIKQLKIRLLI